MAKIPFFDLTEASDQLKAMLGTRPPLNIYKVVAHAGPVGERFLGLGGALLRENALDSKLRELVILRVGILSAAAYEVHQHKRLASRIGVPDEKVAALEEGPEAAVFDDVERAVLRFTDQVVRQVKADAAAFDEVAAHLSHRQLTELLVLIGYYMMVSRFLENLEVEIEEPAGG
jgi:4-carboxymuconolactone decarboxylase